MIIFLYDDHYYQKICNIFNVIQVPSHILLINDTSTEIFYFVGINMNKFFCKKPLSHNYLQVITLLHIPC